ncbi:MAG: dienelactone hydrolase family protein [Acidimicrobiia bacterium]|nr:dienelactone hydrolase family protein [Acidimicrobiia bacterium]
MGDMVEFASNGSTAQGYLAVPPKGSGPGLIVIQEWWGLVPHIRDVCDRYSAAGFVALAPDLYGGTTTTEPDEAGKLMMAMNLDQAAKDLSGAVDYLLASDAVTSTGIGVTGFCMGGGLALVLATQRPDAIVACAPFYGVIPWEHAQPDWSKMTAAVHGHFAENDGMFNPAKVRELERRLHELGKEATFVIHPDVDHAFFNDTREDVYHRETAERAWGETVEFLRANVT